MSALALLDHDIDNDQEHVDAPVLSEWWTRAIEAFDSQGNPNYLDANGQLIPGIYLNLPNHIYHSLDALSSSGLKKFAKNPAIYFREYLSDVLKRKTKPTPSLDIGTLAHELVLEPQHFYTRYFRKPVPIEYPNALITATEIKDKIKELDSKAKVTGTVSELAARLKALDPTVEVYESILEEVCNKQGVEGIGDFEGFDYVTYGGKRPIDGLAWDAALRSAQTVRDEPQADALFRYGIAEVTFIAKCPRTGLWVKCKFDWLRFDDKAVDLKTTQDHMPQEFARDFNRFGYATQQVFYEYVASLLGVNIRQFIFVAVEHAKCDACVIYLIKEKRRIREAQEFQKYLHEFAVCKKENRWKSRYSGKVIALD